MNRERLDKWLEKGMLGLVLAILVYGPLALGAVRTSELLVIQGLTMGAILMWVVRIWVGPGYRFLWPPVCWAVVGFVGYALVRYRFAEVEYVARLELIKILIYAFLFFIIVNNLHQRRTAQIITLVLVFLALGIALYAIYQFITNSDRVWHFTKPAQYLKRGSGTYICPNHLAGFLEMILPLGLAFTLTGRFGDVTRILVGYSSLVILAGIGASISRGGWVATGITLAVFFIVLLRYRENRLPAIVCLAALVALGAVFMAKTDYTKKRFEQLVAEDKSAEDFRFKIWQPAIQIWRDNFWWGGGPDHFNLRYRQYRPEVFQWSPERAHNDYLNTLADWGLTGFGLVLSVWLLAAWGVVKTWKFVKRSGNDLVVRRGNKSAFVLGAALGLLAILLHSFVDFNLHIPANAIVAVSLMALLTGHVRFASERYWANPGWSGKFAVSVVGLIGLWYFGQQGLRLGRECFELRQAAKLESAGPEKRQSLDRLAALRRAHAVEAANPQTPYQIGEWLRTHSWLGREDYEALATEAMYWFERGIKLNRYDSVGYMRYGMCLDWLGRQVEGESYFKRARELDPRSYFMAGHMGWHYMQVRDYQTAQRWFEYSLKLKPYSNPLASTYLEIIKRRLAEPPIAN